MHDFSVIMYLRTIDEFYDRDRLRAFTEGLAANGHYVAGEDRREVGQVWMATLNGESPQVSSPEPESVFTPSVSPVLWDNIETFVEEHSDFLGIYLFSTKREGDLKAFEMTIYLEPEEHTITISMLANPNVLAPFLHSLNILQYIYEAWHPLYSYKEGGVPETTHEDALAGNITYLYEMNLLNRDMVEKLGRERVMSTTAWRVTPLEDGSVFLIPKLIYNGGQDKDYNYDIEETATHLGLNVA
jgi:hypothetical protein